MIGGRIMKLKMKLMAILSLLLCLSMVSTVFADGGGGSNNPFSLKTSNPADGQKKVDVASDINLTFSKNVVNILVKDENKKCFKLLNQEGQAVPIEIIMADDQIEREKRNDIILVPKEILDYEKSYTLVISKDLMSKSGVTLEDEVTISFTTISENAGASLRIWILSTIGVLVLVAIFFITRKRSR